MADSAPDARLVSAVCRHAQAAAARRHRSLVVLAGTRQETLAQALSLVASLHAADVRWHSDRTPPGVPAVWGAAARELLGSEIDMLVFDAWAGFDPDMFGALSGCIRAGGLLLLLTPPLADWPGYADPQLARIAVAPFGATDVGGRFLARLARLVADDCRLLLAESGRLPRLPAGPDGAAVMAPDPAPPPYRTGDQQRAVQALLKVATGHRRRPVVLTSDRGRGKSAAFGIAAARLAQQGRQRILLTAPRAAAVTAVFAQAERLRPGASDYIRFLAPDELVRSLPAADLLLVDEAAAIPVPILEDLLRAYPRIAFATTVHGYEGTGRGFALRFAGVLDALTNSWKSITLVEPIRWAQHDPLEQSVFRLLALDAEPAPAEAFGPGLRPGDFDLQRLDREQLAADEQTLCELFGLLVQAHYRTRPLDLRHLLDGPNLSIYVLRWQCHVAATVMVAAEGGFDRPAAEAIWAGLSRPHGHLLPETLAAHQGLRRAPLLRCGRVMRIAVHPALQRRGLGSHLIQAVTSRLADAGCDYVGSSFGVTPELLQFWFAAGWLPLRLSLSRGASSGAHSAVLARPLSAQGTELLKEARQRLFAQFPHQLADSLVELPPRLVSALLSSGGEYAPRLDAGDSSDLQAFAHGRRLAESAIGSLWRLALRALMTGSCGTLDDRELTLLVMRVLQKRSWNDCAAATGYSGRRQALQALRSVVAKLID